MRLSSVCGLLGDRAKHLCTHIQITLYMAQSPCFLSPLADSLFAPPFSPLYLLGNPPSCDRIRSPRSQVACKLTSLSQPFPNLSPLQIPSTQVTKRLTMTTSRIRLILSGTEAIVEVTTSSYIVILIMTIANFYSIVYILITGWVLQITMNLYISPC
jgi:hypothetical protein